MADAGSAVDAKVASPSCAMCPAASHRCWHCLLRPAVLGVTLVLAKLLIIVGAVLVLVFPSVFRSRIEKSMPLVNGSVTFQAWSSASTPIYMQFWLFNITNPVEFLAGKRPVIQQVGPFTYQERRRKLGVAFNLSDTVLNYQQATAYHFRRDLSCCWEDVNITTLNIVYVGLTHKIRPVSQYLQSMANNLLVSGKHSLIMTRTVAEILWGYHDLALQTAQPIINLAKSFGFTNKELKSRVGLFADNNDTAGGEYSINTGAADVAKLGGIVSWNGSDKLRFWNSSQANMINGTDGAMFSPFVSKSQLLYLFSSDICRSIYLKYTGDVLLHDTLPLYRFQAPAEMFMNASLNPANIGFCSDGHCLDSGVLNISRCKDGSPAVMSQPHFYQAAEQYQQAVAGLSPGPEFDTVLDVEPNTGLVMRAAKKLQLNMAIQPNQNFDSLKHLPGTLIMPLLWLNESACLDAESAAKFQAAVLRPRDIVTRVQWCLIICGILLALAALAGLVYRRRCRCGARSQWLGREKYSNSSTSSSASPRKRGSVPVGNGDGDKSKATLLVDCKSNGKSTQAAAAAADFSEYEYVGNDESHPIANTAETVIGAGA